MNKAPPPAERARKILNRFQVAGLAAYLEGRRRIALRAGWGAGKSYLLGWVALLAGEQGVNVMWVTDTGPRLQTVVQPVCEELLAPAGWRFNGDKNCWRKGKTTIWLRSYFRPSTKAAESNSAEGSNVGLVLLDECQAWTGDEPLRKLFGRARSGPETPVIVMAGLPIWGAWWEEATRKMGPVGAVIHGTSYDNRANLRPEWFADALQTLGQTEYEAMLLNIPRPPERQVYSQWSQDDYPKGNVIRGWQWQPSMKTCLAIDFGQDNPAALVIAEDKARKAWVICAEINPRRPYTLTGQFAQDILQKAWPRRLDDYAPAGVALRFDWAVADPAGKQRRRDPRTGIKLDSDMQILGEMPAGLGPPGHSGIGVVPRFLDGKAPDYEDRNDPRSGILRVGKAMEARRILVTGEVWDEGLKAEGRARSFARAVMNFRRDERGEPIRTEGHDHILDALRYHVRDSASGLWYPHPTDRYRRPHAEVFEHLHSPTPWLDDR